jgi:hypothetical protein
MYASSHEVNSFTSSLSFRAQAKPTSHRDTEQPVPGNWRSCLYSEGVVVGLERGPLSLVSTTEELLEGKVAAPV